MAFDKVGMENLPNVYLYYLRIGKCYEGSTVAIRPMEFVISLYDYADPKKTVWSNQEYLQNYLKARISFVAALNDAGKQQVADLLGGLTSLKDLRTDGTSLLTWSRTMDLKNFTVVDETEESVGEMKRFYKKIVFSQHMLIPNDRWNAGVDVYAFAQPYVDVGELQADFDADFGYTEFQHYLGPLKAEKIYNNSQKVEQSKVFYTQAGAASTELVGQPGIVGDLDRVNYGAVHLRGAERSYMEGSFHSDRSHEKLNVLDLQFQTKIHHAMDCGDPDDDSASFEVGTGTLHLQESIEPNIGVWEMSQEEPWVPPRSEYVGTIDRETENDPVPPGMVTYTPPTGSGGTVNTEELLPWWKTQGHGSEVVKNPSRAAVTPYMSPQVSTDEDGSVNVVTAVNYQQLLLQNDNASRILNNLNPSLFTKLSGLTKMESISLVRADVYSRKHLNKLGMLTGDLPSVSHLKEEVIKTTFANNKLENKTKFVLNDGFHYTVDPKKIKKAPKGFIGKGFHKDDIDSSFAASQVERIELSSHGGVDFISFRDNSVSRSGGNKFKYGLRIEFQAKTKEFIESSVKSIESMTERLSLFAQMASLPGSYDSSKGTWKKNFFIEANQSYGFEVREQEGQVIYDKQASTSNRKNAFWILGPSYYSAGLALLGQRDPEMVKKLFTLMNPVSGTPDTLLEAITIFNKLASRLRSTYDLKKSSPTDSASSTTYSKTGTSNNKHTVEIMFKETVDVILKPAAGQRFVSGVTGRLPTISRTAFRNRANQERRKFFRKSPSVKGKAIENLTSEQQESLVNLDSSYSFFTPMEMKAGEDKKSLSEINESVFDNKFFEKLTLAKASQFGQPLGRRRGSFTKADGLSKIATKFNFSIVPEIKSIVDLQLEAPDEDPDVREYLGDGSHLAVPGQEPRKIFNPTFSKTESDENNQIVSNFASLRMSPSSTRAVNLANFDLKSKDSSFHNFIGRGNSSDSLRLLPVSVKALLIDSESDRTVRFPFAASQFDPLCNIQTRESIRQNFLNIRKLEYLSGFKTINGIIDLSSPIWKLADSQIIDQRNNYLCRLVPFENKEIGIYSEENPPPTFDSLFVIKGKR